MIRIVIETMILFALPTVLYIAFVVIRRQGQPNNTAAQALDDAPLFWLLAIGAALAIGVLAYFGSLDSGQPGQIYIPPEIRDGRIVPGRYE